MSLRATAFALTFFSIAQPAYAYIDPGTGTLIVQMLLAAVAGSLFYMRTIIHKIKSFFRPPQPPTDTQSAEDKEA